MKGERKPTGNRYEIDSFKKLCNVVNEDNYTQIATDFCQWLLYQVHIMSEYRKKHPKDAKGKSNWDIAKASFIWIDDGKNDFKKVIVKDKLTGRVSEISIE